MLPYFVALAIPSVLSLAPELASRLRWTVLGSALLIAFIGLRYDVGADWFGYDIIHSHLADQDLAYALTRPEALSYLVFWLSVQATGDMIASNLVAATVLIGGTLRMCRTTPNAWLAAVAVTPYLLIVFGMSGLRQSLAVGIILWALADWAKLKLHWRLAFVAAATLCHTSAMITLIFVVVDLETSRFRKAAAGLVTVLAAVFATRTATLSSALDLYQARYFGAPGGVVSEGSLFHIALLAGPAVLALAFWSRYRAELASTRLLGIGIIGTFSLFALNVLSSTIASRLTLYFYFLPILVFGTFPRVIARQEHAGVALAVIGFHFAELATWLLFANNSWTYLPYQTIFER